MAYSVSSRYREIVYSGGAIYTCNLSIDGISISPKLISKITISDPIIDTTSESFHLGSFISKQLTIKFKNITDLGLTIKSGLDVDLSISLNVDGTQESVPVGKFTIDELSENYQETCEITCLDYATKFKINVDYSPCFVNNKATIDTILQYICTKCGVQLDSNYPTTNGTVEIGSYDANVSGKQWISYIAEIKGCNAKMGRDGKLYLIPLKNAATTSINALKSKTFDLGERYEITKLVYDDGVTGRYSAISSSNIPSNLLTESENIIVQETGDELYLDYSEQNVVYIRQENPFINGDFPSSTNSKQTIIDNAFNIIKNFIFYNITTENYGDLSLDSYDTINYTVGNNTYSTLNNCTLTYEMNVSTKVENKLPTKEQEETTNMIGENADTIRYKKVQAKLNTVDNSISLLSEEVDENTQDIAQAQIDIQTNTDDIEEANAQVVLKVTSDNKIAKVSLGATPSSSNFDVQADNINFSGKTFNLTSENIAINSTYFNLTKDGNLTANSLTSNNATITGGSINIINETAGEPKIKITRTTNGITYYGYLNELNCVAGSNYQECWIGAYTSSGGIEQYGFYIYDKNNRNTYADLWLRNGNPTLSLLDNGTGHGVTADEGLVTISDKKFKENIEYINKEKSINIIKNLNPVEFNYIDKSKKHRGLIAQEVKKTLNDNDITDEIYSYNEEFNSYVLTYEEFIPDLINCIKYQQEKIEELEERINILERNDK